MNPKHNAMERNSQAPRGRVLRDRRREARRRERRIWPVDDHAQHIARPSGPISDELDSNYRDAARLEKARQQVREGDVHWGAEDEGAGSGSGE